MHLAVVGGGAWFAGALDALLAQDPALGSLELTDDPAAFARPCPKAPQIAIYARDTPRDGLRAQLAHWRKRYPHLRVIVRLKSLRPHLVRDVMQSGAWGCFAEDDAPDILLNLLKTVCSGRVSFPFVDFTALTEDPFEQLTRREREVLAALSRGWTNGQISARLGVSENTVKYHLKLIYEKLGVTNRSAAVAEYLTYTNG